ncbi:MAG: fibronectin type III domain-containing protein [Acidobacteria bacterium]|nr:fibronectin type III domain-containing protein [Acidobacteriota bacterium]
MRASALVITLFSVVAVACGGSPSPSAPSAARPGPATSAATLTVASANALISGASSADLARCLSGTGDAGCFSGARPVTRVATAGATAPGAPSNLVTFLSGPSAHGSNVQLAWTAPTSGDPVVGYVIEAGSASGLADLAVVATGNTLTSFGAPDVARGTYFIRVRAQNGAGISPPSNEAILVTGTPTGCTSAPGAPSGLTSSVSGGTVTLTWSAPTGGCAPTTYGIEAGSAPGKSDLAIVLTGNTSTSFVASGVAAGTYYVRVRAGNGSTIGGVSNEVIVTVGSTTSTSVTGRWIGVAPDGVSFLPEFALCDTADDLQVDLYAGWNGTQRHDHLANSDRQDRRL